MRFSLRGVSTQAPAACVWGFITTPFLGSGYGVGGAGGVGGVPPPEGLRALTRSAKEDMTGAGTKPRILLSPAYSFRVR